MRFHLCQADYQPAVKAVTTSRAGGIVLLVTMVVLLVLATLGYNLVSRVAAQRHRDNYIIDYTTACYARDSAIKYALSGLQEMKNIELISRPNEPDFSDLFNMSEPDYQRLLEQWAEELIKKQQLESSGDANNQESLDAEKPEEIDKEENISLPVMDEVNEINDGNVVKPKAEPNMIDSLVIRGPYGPPWPLVAEPVEIQIGTATVKITIEDENAKYPAGWAVLDDKNVQREAQAGLETFCEWMGFDSDKIGLLKEQLKQVGSIKPFKVDFKPVTQTTPVAAAPAAAARRRGTRPMRTTYRTTNISANELWARQAGEFSKLFHSSLVDTEMLAAPTIISEKRKESALKYMDLWGSTQVNINSAPRQVLEAAFIFGGDADKIAGEIIKERKIKPFTDTGELKKKLFKFSNGIEKCEPYITATSSVFTIHVTASSGVAKASAVIVVLKQGGKIQRVAVVSG
jgi:hypothetical protein